MAAKKQTKLKTNIHSIFATDKKLEEDGAWVEVNGFYGLKIKVRRLRSEAAIKAYERIIIEMFGEGKLRKPSDLSADQSQEIIKRQLAEAVLIDWQNLRDTETGEDIPYSVDVARELMEIGDFREFVFQAASERDTFREKADAEAEGN
ncbi:tail assembly chaperone [Rhodobacter phage RcXuper]|nr:tail assembly chaperone [Rhodobacter phage RcXuper]